LKKNSRIILQKIFFTLFILVISGCSEEKINESKAENKASNETISQDSSSVYKEIIYGDLNAPVTIFEYASLTCSHCASFHNDVLPKLKQAYIDTLKVKLVFRDYPLDNLSMAGAMLARCAPQGRGKAMLKVLFGQQMSWATAQNPIEPLTSYAKLAGMSKKDVDDCLKDESVITAIREEQKRATSLYKIESTPTFFIEETKVEGNRGFEYMSKIIDEKLKQ